VNILREWKFSEAIKIAEVDQYPTDIHAKHIDNFIMNDVPMLPWHDSLEENVKIKLKDLKSKLKDQYKLRLAVLENGELIGWSLGWQDSFDQASFFMGASIVVPEKRKRGIYTALVNKVLEVTKEAGFQTVWSMHLMTNNPVIIAKLKLGFNISGFEVNTLYGSLVKLTYHHSDLRKKALKFRAGAVGEKEIMDLLTAKMKTQT
jgi:GNAT superfamily N-acetyltransferase